MNRDHFWDAIAAATEGDDRATPDSLRKVLEGLSSDDIAAFQSVFDQLMAEAYRWDLWGAAYLICGGCSDDGFTDFRYGLISYGRKVFESALADPDTLANYSVDEECQDESFGYVALEVYEQKTSSELPRDPSIVEPPEPVGDEWDFESDAELEARLPRLLAKLDGDN